MSLTLTVAAANVAADGVVDLLDKGHGDATGDIVFATVSLVVLAICNLSNPAFSDAAGGACTIKAVSQGVVSGSSNPSDIDLVIFRDKSNVEIFRCTVGSGSGDINLNLASVDDGDTIDISFLVYIQPMSDYL